jgi:very-short-patch-repair endonuclease
LVTCSLCNFVADNLYRHVKASHGISCAEYTKLGYGETADKVWLANRTAGRWTEEAKHNEALKMAERNKDTVFAAKANKARVDTINRINIEMKDELALASSARLKAQHKDPVFAAAHSARMSARMKRLHKAGELNVGQSSKWENTTIDALEAKGIEVIRQYHLPRSYKRYDAYLPAHNLLIELDGCYWHSCPIHYPSPKSEVDTFKDSLAKDAGYPLIRIWEHDKDKAITMILERISFEGE